MGIPAPLSRQGTIAKREASCFCPPCENEKVEQLAANNLTIPQDVIASLLQRLVRRASMPEDFRAFEGLTRTLSPCVALALGPGQSGGEKMALRALPTV